MTTTSIDVVTQTIAKTTPVSKKSKAVPLSYRLMIVYRCLLALIGGYVLASLSSIVIAQYYAEYRTSAAMAATLIGFSLHCAAFIWVFMVHKTMKASLGICLPILLLFIAYKLLGN